MDRLIRVLAANRPRLMRELIISVLSEQPGIEIVGVVSDDADIPDCVKQTHPDWLIVALDDPEKRPSICDVILREHPEVRVLAVAPEVNRTVYYWSSPDIRSNEIENSEDGILSAVRSIADSAGRS